MYVCVGGGGGKGGEGAGGSLIFAGKFRNLRLYSRYNLNGFKRALRIVIHI